MEDLKANGFFIEYKDDKTFWRKRIENISKIHDLRGYGFLGELPEIVFLVGSKPHRFAVVDIYYTNEIPEKYMTAINTKFAYAIKCISLEAKK